MNVILFQEVLGLIGGNDGEPGSSGTCCYPSPPLLPQKHPSVLSSPEHTVDLRGATLAWATKDKSSKKNVLEVREEPLTPTSLEEK